MDTLLVVEQVVKPKMEAIKLVVPVVPVTVDFITVRNAGPGTGGGGAGAPGPDFGGPEGGPTGGNGGSNHHSLLDLTE